MSTDARVVARGRPPAVAGSFYPSDRAQLRAVVGRLLLAADHAAGSTTPASRPTGLPLGLLVPHAGLAYSGVVAAGGWRELRDRPDAPLSVVILGTNHRAGWLHGVGVWDDEPWLMPADAIDTDRDLARAIADLGPPFLVDRAAHLGEHSIEVQLPLLHAVAPGARVVPLAVAAGTGAQAIAAGARLGRLLAAHRRSGERLVLAISTDMAHYPRHVDAVQVTELLMPAILSLDAERLASLDAEVSAAGIPGLVCGMCGIEPAILGLAALRAAGADRGVRLASATSADAGGPPERTVGYLAVRFEAPDR